MTTFEIVIIAMGLAMDASAVSLAAAGAGYAKDARAIFRLSFHFGLFQFLMPVLGWYLGIGFAPLFKTINHWIAFFILTFIGIKMIREGMGKSPGNQINDPSRGMTMVMLSVATSIDALVIGFGFAMLEVNIWYPSIMIGVITAVMSFLAIKIGIKMGALFGKQMEIFGGLILIFIGTRILFSHLF